MTAYFFLTDALITVFAFISIYASDTLKLSLGQIFTVLLIVQIIAFPAAIILGLLSDRIGQKKVLLGTIFGWVIVMFLLIFSKSLPMYYLIAVLTGFVIGGSQSVGRSWYSQIIPASRESEFFGFNALSSKISAVVGPVLFGLVSSITGSQRLQWIQ